MIIAVQQASAETRGLRCTVPYQCGHHSVSLSFFLLPRGAATHTDQKVVIALSPLAQADLISPKEHEACLKQGKERAARMQHCRRSTSDRSAAGLWIYFKLVWCNGRPIRRSRQGERDVGLLRRATAELPSASNHPSLGQGS